MATLAVAVSEAVGKVELRLGLHYVLLAAAYDRWQADGLFAQIFSRHPEMALEQFLDWCYSPTVEPVGCFVGDLLVGVGWINQARRVDGAVAAEVGAAFFKGTPLPIWRESIGLLVNYAFEDRGFIAIYGLCSKSNRAARIFTRECGMRIIDYLPWKESVGPDFSVYHLDRLEWRKRYGTGRKT